MHKYQCVWYPWSHELWQDVRFFGIPDHRNHGRTCCSLISLITWIMTGHAVLWYSWWYESWQDTLFCDIPDHMNHDRTRCSVIFLMIWIRAGRAVLWYPWSHESWQDTLFCDISDHMNHGRTCCSLKSLITWIMTGHAVLWYLWSHESRQDVRFFYYYNIKQYNACSTLWYGAGHICRRVERPYQNNGYLSLNWFCIYTLVKFSIPIYLSTYHYSLIKFYSHQLMHFLIQPCISVLSYIKIT